jgi:hypothetical protein
MPGIMLRSEINKEKRCPCPQIAYSLGLYFPKHIAEKTYFYIATQTHTHIPHDIDILRVLKVLISGDEESYLILFHPDNLRHIFSIIPVNSPRN